MAARPVQCRHRGQAIEIANPRVNAVVETYPDRLESLDERTLGAGPFRGVPFLMKDVFGHENVSVDELPQRVLGPVCQYTLPHNIMGTPAISLPLAMHTSGLPIGVQLAAGAANEHLLLQLAAALELAMPWAEPAPPLHVTKAA